MPITIKTGTMKYKKPNGEYEAFNAVAQESTGVQIASIESAGAAQISSIQSAGAATVASIPNDYTTLTNNVSQLSEEMHDEAISKNMIGPKPCVLYPVKLKNGDVITVSTSDGQTGQFLTLRLYDSDKSYIGYYNITNSANPYRTITLPQDIYYLEWRPQNTSTQVTGIPMVERSSTRSEFVPWFSDVKKLYEDANQIYDVLNNTVFDHLNSFSAQVGGNIQAYPTRVNSPAKMPITSDMILYFEPLKETTFGTSYMVSYNVYAADGSTIVNSLSWSDSVTATPLSLKAGQFLTLATKYYPIEVETSSDEAIDLINDAVVVCKNVSNRFDALNTDNLAYGNYYTFYVTNGGKWEVIKYRPGTKKDGTSFGGTAVLIHATESITAIRSNNPYTNTKGSYNYPWANICTSVGNSHLTTIDDTDYIVLNQNEKLCFDMTNLNFRVLAQDDSTNGYVVLIMQKSTQINGGFIAPKLLYDELNTRCDTIQSSVSDLETAVGDTYTFPVADVIINRDLQNDSSLMFLWASDTHHQIHGTSTYGVKTKQIAEMRDVANQVKADFIAITGDVVNGYHPVSEQKTCLVNFVNTLRKHSNIPVFITEGNHDDNSWYASANGSGGTNPTGLAECLSNEQFTNYSMTNAIKEVHFNPDDPLGGYYYVDFKKPKIRVIALNVMDIPYIENQDLTLQYYGQWTFGFQESQMQWLANTALKFTESGWGVVFLMHFDGQLDDATTNTISDPKCWYYVKQIIAAFKAKGSGSFTSNVTDFPATVSYDFTQNASDEVIAYFSGHVHRDRNATVDGVPHISIVCSFNDGASGGYGYDIVTIDRDNEKIYTKRYNNGALSAYNREISYGS